MVSEYGLVYIQHDKYRDIAARINRGPSITLVLGLRLCLTRIPTIIRPDIRD